LSRLLLVRHAVTGFNSTHRFAGHRDTELSPIGCQQAERLRDRLRDDKIDAVYSSDLRRALVTAETIATGRRVDIITCPELREIDYGATEGLTPDEVGRRYPEVAEALASSSPGLEFPGGETLHGLAERVGRFLEKLGGHKSSETVLIVSHRGPMRVMICRLLGIGLEHWRQISLDNASLSIVATSARGAILSLLNETSYLKGVNESD